MPEKKVIRVKHHPLGYWIAWVRGTRRSYRDRSSVEALGKLVIKEFALLLANHEIKFQRYPNTWVAYIDSCPGISGRGNTRRFAVGCLVKWYQEAFNLNVL